MLNKQFPRIYFGAVDPYKDDVPIQIFKLTNNSTMNQQEKVIDVFKALLKKGPTTTLDVKLKLREELPMFSWTQEFVSDACFAYACINTDVTWNLNGNHYVYSIKVSPSTSKEYVYVTADGTTLKNTDKDTLELVLVALGEQVHWSESKDQFIPINSMHDNHLLNTIWKRTENMSPKEVAQFIQCSLYVKELISRYPI